MSTSDLSNLEQLERQVYETTWDDGLIDLCVGTTLLLIGIFWVTGLSPYSTFAAPVMVPVWVMARKRISEPRMGVVQFSTERAAKEKHKLFGLFLFGVLTLVIGISWYFFGLNDASVATLRETNIVAGLPAALLAIPAIVVAFSSGLGRFLAYAATLLFSALPVVLLDLHPGWAFLPCGVLCVGIGTGLLAKFIRKYPL